MVNKTNKKAFTIIELIVVMAIIGILVLIATPKLMGHTKQAKVTKLVVNTKQLETASERYYMDKNDWPRLSDTPYTSSQIATFAQEVHDSTGKVVVLDPTGSYYDIDYGKLTNYISLSDNKANYIIQNPVGNVYALDGLVKAAETRATDIKATGINLDITDLNLNIGVNQKLIATIQPDNASIKTLGWSSSNESIATVDSTGNITAVKDGSTVITITSWDKSISVTCNLTVNVPFTSQTFDYVGNYQTFTVPLTGTYKLEAWGESAGGNGGYSVGETTLNIGNILYINAGIGSGGGGYTTSRNASNQEIYISGGGGTDIRLAGLALSNRLIVAGGGGGGISSFSNAYATGQGAPGGGLIGVPGGKATWSWCSINGGTGGTAGGNYGGGGQTTYCIDGQGAHYLYSGGGGGSSYLGTLANATTTVGVNTGAGKATITYIGQ